MGYRELFLVLVSVVMLTTLMVQINSNAVESQEAMQTLEIEHTAASIAQQFIEEAKSKNFDALSMTPISMPSGFTPYHSLGHGYGEVYPNFNDVDDYNNFVDTLMVNGIDFRVSIRVHYVQDSNPDQAVSTNTFYKRMRVTVSSSWLPQAITFKHVFSYFGVNM